MRSLSFLQSTPNVEKVTLRSCSLIRRHIIKIFPSRECDVQENDSMLARIPGILFTTVTSNIANSISIHVKSKQDDDLTMYLDEPGFHMVQDSLKASHSIAGYWVSQTDRLPILSRVALRKYATPPSSSSSERDFSLVNRLITYHRTRLEVEIFE